MFPRSTPHHGLTLPSFSILLLIASLILALGAGRWFNLSAAEPVTRLSMPTRECPAPREGQVLMVIFSPNPEQPGKFDAICRTAKARG